MTSEQLLTISGVVLSLAFMYIPGLREKYAGLSDELKRSIMAGILLLVAGATYFLSCQGLLGAVMSQAAQAVTCDQAGLVELVWAFVLAMIGNQATYQLAPRPASVKAAKAAAK